LDKLDSKLRDENYCKSIFGMHATEVIMDAVNNSISQTAHSIS